jgi:TP901 family phage tail tape measure protein
MSAAGAALGKVFVAGTVVAAAAIATFAVNGVKSFANLQTGMNEVFTLLPGITETAMQSMTDDTRAFAVEMGTTTDEVVPALYQAISAGVPAGSVFDFLEVAQKAALGGVTELTTAVDGISSVVNAYGDDVIDAATASDQMFTAVRLGKTNFEELSSSLFNVTPTAAALGVKFGDVTAGLAAMTAQGVPTNVATTQMRQLFVELSKAGGDTAKVFEDASGKTFKDFIASGGNVNDALDIMGNYAADSGIGISDLFGSVEGGQAALALFDNSAFTGALSEMDASAGATDAAYEQMDQGLGRTWERIKSVFSDAAISIGEKLAPKVQELATWFSEWLPGAIDATFAAFTVVSDYITGTVVPAIQGFVTEFQNGEGAGGKFRDVLTATRDALVSVADYITGTAIPAVQNFSTWVNDNKDKAIAVAGVITAVLLPGLATWATVATVSAAKAVAAWFLTETAAIRAGIAHTVTGYKVIGSWIASAAAAVSSGAVTVAIWALYATEAVKGAAITVASHARMAAVWVASKIQAGISAAAVAATWVASSARVAAGLIAQAAAHVATRAIVIAGAIATGVATAAQWLFNAALSANPIGLMVVAIAALVAGLVWFFTKTETGQKLWKTFTEVLSAGWDAIKGAFSAGWDAVSGFLGNVWDLVKKVWGYSPLGLIVTNWTAILDFFRAIPGKIAGFIGNIGTKIAGYFTTIKATIKGYVDSVTGYFKAIPGKIAEYISGIGTKASGYFKTFKTNVKSYVDSVLGWFKDIPGKIGGFMSSVGSKITAPFKAAFNAVARFWNNSVGKVNFSVPDWVPGVGGKSFGIPNIPYLADGGVVDRATLAMIGEGSEPEAVIPLSKLDEMLSGKGKSSGITQENHFYGLMDAATAAQEMLRRLQMQGV